MARKERQWNITTSALNKALSLNFSPNFLREFANFDRQDLEKLPNVIRAYSNLKKLVHKIHGDRVSKPMGKFLLHCEDKDVYTGSEMQRYMHYSLKDWVIIVSTMFDDYNRSRGGPRPDLPPIVITIEAQQLVQDMRMKLPHTPVSKPYAPGAHATAAAPSVKPQRNKTPARISFKTKVLQCLSLSALPKDGAVDICCKHATNNNCTYPNCKLSHAIMFTPAQITLLKQAKLMN